MKKQEVSFLKWLVPVVIILLWASGLVTAQEIYNVKAHYDKAEYMIPMRDGVKIYTQVYTPKDKSQKYPFMLSKTPYAESRPSPDYFHSSLGPGPARKFMQEGFIFVYQHHRGKGGSEGEFVHHPVYIADKKSPKDIDDNSDTFDSIDWLLKNIPNHNGKVGMWGVSYGGWHTAMACIDAHPALVAASPQGTPGDQFIGDDYHHYGAFRLAYAFNWTSGTARLPGAERVSIPRGADAYDFFLELGPISNVNKNLFKNTVPTWNEFMTHGDYDEYWQSKSLPPDMDNVKLAVLNVVGWFDAEDYYGALEIYKSIEQKNPVNKNYLVVGPWNHGGWDRGLGNEIGPFKLDRNTSQYFQHEIQFPFFLYHLKGKGAWNVTHEDLANVSSRPRSSSPALTNGEPSTPGRRKKPPKRTFIYAKMVNCLLIRRDGSRERPTTPLLATPIIPSAIQREVITVRITTLCMRTSASSPITPTY